MHQTTEKKEITVNIRLADGQIGDGLTAAEISSAVHAILEAAESMELALAEETEKPHYNGLRIGMGYDGRPDANVYIRINADDDDGWS